MLFIVNVKKSKFLTGVFLSVASFYFTLCACVAPPPQNPWFSEKAQDHETVLKRKIAQMLILGFRGTEFTPDTSVYKAVTEYGIGGVLLFDYDIPSRTRPRNILSKNQLKRLTSDLQEAAPVTLFISIDQEGGRVNRLRSEYGFPPNLSAKDMAASPGLTKPQAESTAAMLAELGINLNFAPCVDLNLNPENPVIGAVGRSFSANPDVVVQHASLWIDAHKRMGVLSCIKHFPGHGSSTGDTHHGWVDVTNQWQEVELIPYRRLLSAYNTDLMVMTSHVFNKKLDPVYPATLSYNIITGILRNTLKFNGLVVSDDLDMEAVKSHYTFAEALEKSINAGVDLLCLSNNGNSYDPALAEKALDTIFQLVQQGTIPESRIDESWKRIMAAKRSFTGQALPK